MLYMTYPRDYEHVRNHLKRFPLKPHSILHTILYFPFLEYIHKFTSCNSGKWEKCSCSTPEKLRVL